MRQLRLSITTVLFAFAVAGCGGKVVVESASAAAGGAGGMGSATATSSSASATGDVGADVSAGVGGGGVSKCATDADCAYGAEWCVASSCVPCDDSGRACDIQCEYDYLGWGVYERNGCIACECAPPQGCTSDAECGNPGKVI